MELRSQIEVFRTGKPYEILMAVEELRNAGIPVFCHEESGGMRTAMPQTPVAGPDIHWVIKVPDIAVEEALEILQVLPIHLDPNPGSWDFQPGTDIESEWRKGIRIGFVFVLLMFVMFMFFLLVDLVL